MVKFIAITGDSSKQRDSILRYLQLLVLYVSAVKNDEFESDHLTSISEDLMFSSGFNGAHLLERLLYNLNRPLLILDIDKSANTKSNKPNKTLIL